MMRSGVSALVVLSGVNQDELIVSLKVSLYCDSS